MTRDRQFGFPYRDDGRFALPSEFVVGSRVTGDDAMQERDVPRKCVRIFEGHNDKVNSVCLSADGRWALSGSDDATLRLWEVSSGRCVRIFEGHVSGVTSVALSTDGCWALSGGWYEPLLLWEVSTGRCVRIFHGHTFWVTSVALSADGCWALSGSWDGTFRLWEVSTGRCVRTFEGHSDAVTSVSLSADGRWAISGSKDKTLCSWDLRVFAERSGPVANNLLSRIAQSDELARVAGHPDSAPARSADGD